MLYHLVFLFLLFFFNDTATTEIYTLSLHDALPISMGTGRRRGDRLVHRHPVDAHRDRKSTRLNSSHANISYAVFCLKKKNNYISNVLFKYNSIHECMLHTYELIT